MVIRCILCVGTLPSLILANPHGDGCWQSTEAEHIPWAWQRSLYGLLSPALWAASTCSFPCWSVSTLNAEPESPDVSNTSAGTWLMPYASYPLPSGEPAREPRSLNLARASTLNARGKVLQKNVCDSYLHVHTSCFVQTLTFLSPLCHLTWPHDNHQKNAFIPRSCGSAVAAAIPGHVGCSMGDCN